MATSPFPVDPVLTGIVMAYRNASFIADMVLPRIDPPFERQEFKYHVFTQAEGYNILDTKVGRRGVPNEIDFSAAEVTGKTQDYGLDDVIPNPDFDNAPPGYDPASHAAENLADLVALDREKRVADVVFAAATYPTANKVTLAGNDQWSDYVNSDPVDDINVALDTPLLRPNIGVFGRATFTKLASHPKIVKAVHGNDGDSGRATRRQIAELFELSDVLVGEGFYNTAKRGQTAAMSRVWGKHAALLHINKLARNDNGRVTFGYTAQFGTKVAGRLDEPKTGLRGSVRVRAGESVKEVISASDVGYLFTNAVA